MINQLKTYFLELKRNQYLKREELDNLILKKLKFVLNYSYKNVPFYEAHFKRNKIKPEGFKTISDISKFPITTKADIKMSNLSYISKEFENQELHTSRTSGSTGEPFVSYFDREAWNKLKFASKMRARRGAGFSFNEKFVIIEALTQEEIDDLNKQKSLKNFLIRGKYLTVYDSLKNHIDFYEKFKPDSIYAFPSYFVNLGNYIEEKNIKLPYVKKLFTSSELLDRNTRKRIKEMFGCEVYDVFGSTELKEVSWECSKNEGYHINEDLVYVEIVDEKFRPVKDGKEGGIVITSLENKAMPLIRYYIGDTGTILTQKCSCGRTFKMMKPSHGRIVDYFTLSDGRKLSPYEITMSVEGIPGIMQYQIIQKTKTKVLMNLKINKKFEMESKKIIDKKLKNILGNDVKSQINIVDSFENNNNSRNKFRIVMSEVKE